MVTITAFPQSALVDEKISVRVVGLPANSSITVRASVRNCGKTYDSCAHFQTGCAGHLSLNEHPSLGGTYSGVQGMGLFTSMLPSPKEKRGSRLLKKDVSTPLVNELTVYNGFLTVNEIYKSSPKVLAKTNVERWYISKDVETIPVKSGKIRGIVFKPKGLRPFPGVIDLFGGVGGLTTFRSSLLASHGFASLALPYFGYKDLTASLASVTMDYFVEAVDWLLEQPYIHKDGIGLIGVSVGAQIVLKLSTIFGEAVDWLLEQPYIHKDGIGLIGVSVGAQIVLKLSTICGSKIKACVSINGCPYNTGEYPPSRYNQRHFPVAQTHPEKIEFRDGALILLNYFPKLLTNKEKDAVMQLEKSDCEFLFISGDDDHCWSGSLYAKFASNYLTSHGKKNWQILSYPGAGHLIEPPYSPLCAEVFLPFLGSVTLYGGIHDCHALAQEDSWKKTLAFFHKYVGKSVPTKRMSSIVSLPLNSKL
ncbi:acyl-coenzyme A amino acid N-acyltransferase 1-like [Anneissia japonica]|uniref:acyl-coenzyme A amino acid N-acyltransferase 1-like n=1 Tax=Anneissia japonica TaxID=1529436 RepID=UPI0014256319|nr:acyl-coenzyme A amino acid N-acyltransferase 1-like [Anneissia japonica]